MNLCGLLLVLVAVGVQGDIEYQANLSGIEYIGSGCPVTEPEACIKFSEQIGKLSGLTTTSGTAAWHAATAAGKECAVAANTGTCSVEIEIGLFINQGNVCQSLLGYQIDDSLLGTNWQIRQIRATLGRFPECAATGSYYSEADSLCNSVEFGEKAPFLAQGTSFLVEGYNPIRAMVFPDCTGGTMIIMVELIHDERPTTIPITTAEADGENSPPSSDKSEDGVVTDDPAKPGTDPEKPGTDPEKPGTDPEKPGTDPEKPGPDSAARSAILSILLLTIIAAI